jgi:hypothetical protein
LAILLWANAEGVALVMARRFWVPVRALAEWVIRMVLEMEVLVILVTPPLPEVVEREVHLTVRAIAKGVACATERRRWELAWAPAEYVTWRMVLETGVLTDLATALLPEVVGREV